MRHIEYLMPGLTYFGFITVYNQCLKNAEDMPAARID
jgi:hypothetical protein